MPSNNSEKQPIKGPVELLKEAWANFSKNPTTYIKIMLLTYLVSIASILPLVIIGFGIYMATQNAVLAVAIPGVVFIPLMIYLQSWLTLGLTNALMLNTEGTQIGAIEAVKAVRPMTVPYIVTSLLMGIIILGGFILFIVPGIILSILFSLFTFILLRENKVGMNALLTSREYIRGYGWKVVLYMITFWFVSYIVTVIPTQIFERLDLSLLSSLYTLIVNFVIAPLGILYSIGIYKELKRVKGEVVVENLQQRKTKYLALGVFGILVGVVGLVTGVNLILNILNSTNWSDANQYELPIENMEEEIYDYSESV